jgi:hypothetical protein
MAPRTQPTALQDALVGWWPSRYGADDQAGALNEITPGKMPEAIGLVRQGLVYDLAHVLHQDIPAFPGRTFRQYLTTNYHHINRRSPDAGPDGLGRTSVNDYYFGDPDDDGTFPYPLGALQMLGKNDATLIAFDAPDAEDPADLARHSMDFWLTTEDLPLPGNQVLLGRDGRIRLRYTQANAEAHRRLRGKFEGLLDAIQCRDIVLPGYHYLGGRLGINAVAHQNGTVRFGTDPAASALDLNCKLHDLDNLYVVDSSFFVSGTAVNPTLAIIANALRVADHIAGRLGAADRHGARPEPVTAHA